MSARPTTPHIGSLIHTARTKLGMSQRELADAVGCSSAPFMSDIERGYRWPAPQTLANLQAVLRIDLESLDPREALATLRRLAETDPAWCSAIRMLASQATSGAVTAEEFLAMLENEA